MKRPKCSWHDYYKVYSTCDHQIPEERNYIKEGFLRCHDCGAITHTKTRRRWKSKDRREDETKRTKKMINHFPSLKGVNRRTDRRILKIFLPGFRIQSDILTDFRILQLQRIADSSVFWTGADFGLYV